MLLVYYYPNIAIKTINLASSVNKSELILSLRANAEIVASNEPKI